MTMTCATPEFWTYLGTGLGWGAALIGLSVPLYIWLRLK